MSRAAPADPLQRYASKRNFDITAEPKAVRARTGKRLGFVIQKHWASRLHYDFRLELDGVLVSWAVPKGPSFDPQQKRMAVHVEDHPVRYGSFEGTIPAGQYGAGNVIIWDNGHWEPQGDARAGLAAGKLVFRLHGQKLAGLWELVRTKQSGARQEQWLLFKKKDAWARPLAEYDVITALPDSVVEHPLGPVEEREPRQDRPEPTRARAGTEAEPDLTAARKAALPERLAPQLATLVARPPAGGDWVCENKFDGYRILARIERGRVRLFTRRGLDWTAKMASLADEVAKLGLDSAWLDGEIVVLNAHGMPDFNALQNAMDASRSAAVTYFVFDAPFMGGVDLRAVPLWSRRATLQKVFEGVALERVRFSAAIDALPAQLLQAACQMQLEGIMLKRADAPYVSDRTDTWLKLKCVQRQEFVVCGYTDRSNAPAEVGSLLLGYHEDGRLRYGGSVGTGWSNEDGRAMYKALQKLRTERPPFDAAAAKPGRWSRRGVGSERWVHPKLVAEVAFSEWTPDGHVRHASFKGWRSDKSAREITRERGMAPPGTMGNEKRDVSAGPSTPIALKITNPDRVIDPSTGFMKRDLVHYYESVAERILPHLQGRPVSLVRAPTGINGELFFQKHPETKMPGLMELDPALWPGHTALLAVQTAQALLAAAQMNVVEFHTWNSTVRSIDKPDRVIFDLDPGEGVSWRVLVEDTLLTKALLDELGLQSWLKTSGGKGLHVVVPIARRLSYDAVKDFSQALVQHLARTIPSRFVAKSGPSNRVGKVFVDYLRNGHAQTTAAAFSARARPGLGVSVPITWEALPELKSSAQWSIATAREYLSFERSDPWADYWSCRQTLTRAIKTLAASA
jgi:bifunctional non-homologous end joining protein LigD